MSSVQVIHDATSSEIFPRSPNWFAVYTRVNQEKKVAEWLDQRGIEHFLPLYETARRRTDRRVVLHLPLFPGYLFVRIPLEERLRVLQVPRVVRIVGNSSAPIPLPENEIESLQLGIAKGARAKPCQYLNKGCRVRLTKGPFAGMTGILLRRKAGFRLVISIDLIQQSFTVEVGEEDLERIY